MKFATMMIVHLFYKNIMDSFSMLGGNKHDF